MKDKKLSKAQLLKVSTPIRELLQELLAQKIKTGEDRARLAKFLGKSVASVNKMVYSGEMGLDLWVNSLVYCYDFDPNALKHYIKNLPHFLHNQKPIAPADKIWAEVSGELTQEEKMHYGHLLKCSIKANRYLGKKEVKNKNKKKREKKKKK